MAPRNAAVSVSLAVLVVAAVVAGVLPRPTRAAVEHLVVSEVVTGGASASDEFIEIYNPSSTALPLEGLELVYVTASGATISRRAAWSLGSPTVPPGGHVLVANEAGIYAPIADIVYASGMAATGGSVAIRIQGATTSVDAVGWGSAASAWMEGAAAAAPGAGESLERLPGGDLGSTVDTGSNAADFSVRAVPGPRNASSAPVPSASASPTDPPPTDVPATSTATPSTSATPSLTPTPQASPTPSTPSVISVADARQLADDAPARVLVTALTGSDFTDGGGFVADATAGIAVLSPDVPFSRGERMLVSGTLDDRFAQRTLRAETIAAADGPAVPEPITRATADVGESVEGRLVRIDGLIDGPGTALSGSVAFDVDDGSGSTRVVVGTLTGIDTSTWVSGSRLRLVGVVGQRDSSGTGAEGYRLHPRDADDVESVSPPASPTPTAEPTGTADPSPSASAPAPGTMSIADVRRAAKNARVALRGVVTLPTGLLDEATAVVQDSTGAILLRLGDEAGALQLGELVDLNGTRSTKSGMESVRVTASPSRVGTVGQPAPLALRTGDAAESHEARLVSVRGGLTASARRASSGTVSFTIDDGSGELRVVVAATVAVEDEALERGAWVEVVGVLGQETSGSQPTRGYRVWPRTADEVRVVTPAGTAAAGLDESGAAPGGATAGGGTAETATLGAIDSALLAELRVGATLVVGRWEAAGLAGVLWDGRAVVGIAESSHRHLTSSVLTSRLPISVELSHLQHAGMHPELGIALVALGRSPGDVVASSQPTAPAVAYDRDRVAATWATIVGRRAADRIHAGAHAVGLTIMCDTQPAGTASAVSVTGIALAGSSRIVAPCHGVRPASALALRGLGLQRAASDVTAGDDAAEGVTAAADREGRPAAAALLALGGLVVAGGAVGHRRLRVGRARDGSLDGPTSTEPAGPAGDPADETPRLTLVAVPREHGP